MAAVDLSCLESGLGRHGPAWDCAVPAGQLSDDMARFPMPDVANVSPRARQLANTQDVLEREV